MKSHVMEVREYDNGHEEGYVYVSKGPLEEFQLPHAPESGTLVITTNGLEASIRDYSVDKSRVSFAEGKHARQGDTVTFRYKIAGD